MAGMFGHDFRGGLPAFGGHYPNHAPQETFDEEYCCYSFAVQDKTHLEGSDKIFLPPSALETLARLHIDYPMLFKITCKVTGRSTHCGVLEFSAAEGTCFLPFWMMQNLLLEEGGFLRVVNVSLPKATFVKFRPQSVDFLDISNPRAVLERALRNFSCVTVGDQICIPYNNKYYYLEVREVKPADAACIIETDCNVDFEPPVGYKEPERKTGGSSAFESKGGLGGGPISIPRPLSAKGGYVAEKKEEEKPKAFTGSGQRLDGKSSRSNSVASESEAMSGVASPLPIPPPSATSGPRPLGGRTVAGGPVSGGGQTLGGGQRLGGGNGAAQSSEGRRPVGALGGKFSTKKNFASFGGAGNSLK